MLVSDRLVFCEHVVLTCTTQGTNCTKEYCYHTSDVSDNLAAEACRASAIFL